MRIVAEGSGEALIRRCSLLSGSAVARRSRGDLPPTLHALVKRSEIGRAGLLSNVHLT
jgi:hypothetical protein